MCWFTLGRAAVMNEVSSTLVQQLPYKINVVAIVYNSLDYTVVTTACSLYDDGS